MAQEDGPQAVLAMHLAAKALSAATGRLCKASRLFRPAKSHKPATRPRPFGT
jgi:hypothetical protein